MGSHYVDKNKGHVFLRLSEFTLIIFFQTIQVTGLIFFKKMLNFNGIINNRNVAITEYKVNLL